MFTGIIEIIACVHAVIESKGICRLSIANHWHDVRLGESIAVNGCCLTVAETPGENLCFDVIAETLDKTNLGLLRSGDLVNLERALRIGDRLDGHFVQGHVDDRAMLIGRVEGEQLRLQIQPPETLRRFLVPKGSVTLDGVSLTIASLQESVFEVALIPTTINLTTLGNKPIGWPLNLEVDILTKTIISCVERQTTNKQNNI